MSDLANDIVAAKRAMNEFYSIKARPSALPPASVEELCVLAAELKRRGVPFPPSYRAFLTGCNGIRHFDRNLDLLPAATVMQPADQTLESDFPALAKFVIASGNRPAFIDIDPRTASAAGEMEVVWVTTRVNRIVIRTSANSSATTATRCRTM